MVGEIPPMTTQQDVTSAWRAVERANDELLAYAKPGAFFFDTKRFNELTEKLRSANEEYVRLLTEWANSVLRK